MPDRGRFEVVFFSVGETAIAIDRGARLPVFGNGTLDVGLQHIVLDGTQRVISQRSILATGVVSIAIGFLVAVMWAGERWPPAGLAILATLVAVAAFLFKHRKRDVPFRWEVPWKDVSSFFEVPDSSGAWGVTLTGAPLGTVMFAVPAATSAEFAELMVSLHENKLTRVTFLERELPAAVVVHRS
jgi:hypothetical protein